jgi:alanyl-tRNA synthetase
VTGNEIRETFLRFFEQKGHKRVRSSSLVPVNDPTLLFTNAGMNQFKDVFLGLEQRDYKRATTSQKCVRAGGKHNDLENVGFTNRHHTFFEMLGNFSFGDYYKKDAIPFAWELLTSQKWFALPKDKLYVTIFEGSDYPELELPRDAEAESVWLQIGVPRGRVLASGMKDNFWQMGDTGPCGPCSEIHFDMGPAASEQGHTDCRFPCDCGRYVEVWNLVFMQYNRDVTGTLEMLPKPSVDTGMGLERIAAVLLHLKDPMKVSNYDTDLFQPLIASAQTLINLNKSFENNPRNQASLRIIADHARATTFLISDGVVPSNEGRGYVLRKILRRGIRHGRLLGQELPFMFKMVFSIRDAMGVAYPELFEKADQISKVIEAEEQQFARVLEIGLQQWDQVLGDVGTEFVSKCVEKLLEDQKNNRELSYYSDDLPRMLLSISPGAYLEFFSDNPEPLQYFVASKLGPGRAKEFIESLKKVTSSHRPSISGEAAFRLYETYGLPLDFMIDAARDQRFDFDLVGFERAKSAEQARARASWKGSRKEAAKPVYVQIASAFHTVPQFYFTTSTRDCRVEAIIKAGTSVSEIIDGEGAEIVLDHTAIYSESGGQVADTGKLYDNAEAIELAEIKGAYYPVAGLIAHRIVARDNLRVGDRVATVADAARREHIKRNHTATHLMHAALRNILGTHVKQAGSLVEPGRLRFDFSHFAPIDSAELRDIEQQVNEEILLNNELETAVLPIDEALASGALAFFGDRYPETNVRVVTIPDKNSPRGFYSKELCGGTHVRRSGDIGIFKIVTESSVAAGVRRIEAISGVRGIEEFQRAEDKLRSLASKLGTSPDELEATAQKLIEARRDLEKQLGTAQRKSAQSSADDLMAQAQTIKGVRLISAQVPEMGRDALRGLVDTLRQKLGSGVVVLGMTEDGKVALIGGVTKDLTAKLHAGKIIQAIAKEVGGSGGGRPDLAEAGGKDTVGLNRALVLVSTIIDQLL